MNLEKDVRVIDTLGFTTHHWLYLLRNLEADSVAGQMKTMDSLYHLSASTNAEIQCDWYILSINSHYMEVYPYMEKYLLSVGRRKFLKPIYERLASTPEGLELGRNIFFKAEKSYHAVSRNTVKSILRME